MEKTINDKSERIFIGKAYIRYIIPAALAMIFGQLAPLVDSVCVSAKLGGYGAFGIFHRITRVLFL